MANRLSRFLVVGLSLGFAACGGGGNLTLPSEGEPAAIAVETGWNGTTGRVGTEVAPLNVVVTDTKNRPVAGSTVEFEVTAGGGLVNPTSAVTGNDGKATTHLTLGNQVGPVTGVARVPVPAGRVPVQTTFTATAVSADAFGIAPVSGDNQSGLVGTKLALPLVVQVTDGFGNPKSDVTIEWSVTGGGSVSPTTTQTDPNGRASVERTLGAQAVPQTTVATAPGLANSPLSFKHTANAGIVSSVVKISGDGQSVPAGSTIAVVVEVRDANSNPIPNQPVNWLIGEGGGSRTPATGNTNGQGQATAQWTLGATPGNNTLNVVSGGASTTFTATGTGTGLPSTLAVIVQPTDVTVGVPISPAPEVQTQDARGNNVAVAGLDVTAALRDGSGRLDGTFSATTDASGRARFTDLRVTGGSGRRRILFSAEGYQSATSDRFTVNKANPTTTITSDQPDPSTPGQSIHVTFTVTVAGGGTPTGSIDIFSLEEAGVGCTVPVSQGSCDFLLNTAGLHHLQAFYNGDAQTEASSDLDGENHVVNAPPTAAFNAPTACVAATPCQFTDASTDSEGPIATWSWNFGDPGSLENTSSSQNPTHTFLLSSTYNVLLTVTDQGGASSSVSHDVVIQ
jgi:PKD repeat protein